ncbi:MAG TPA: septum formation initiator family protein [Gemmatimonadales bacterium]|nr:septum formation initiator family protein [Gemmatimonadales bacterium]
MTPARITALAGGLALVAFAIFAGEYSTGDWLKLRRQLAQERDSVAALQVAVDSLSRAAHDLETNPATQERVAREEFGMIRNGETLYRLVPKGRPATTP